VNTSTPSNREISFLGCLNRAFLAVIAAWALAGCASMIASAGSGMAQNLTKAMMNQDDPEIVRDGAPAYLLMLDSFVEGSPDNAAMLGAAAELYAAYGVVFVDDAERASKLTVRARSYGQRSLCASDKNTCGIWNLEYDRFVESLDEIDSRHTAAVYTFGLSWIAYIQAHSADYSALAKLPHAEAVLLRLQKLDPEYQQANVEHYLAILNTIRPPALGGNFEAGLAHFQRAIDVSDDQDLSIKVSFARYYARTLYDRELHDRLLREVLEADPDHEGYVLMNTLAQQDARLLLGSADDYF
jgi:tetratricopeptide (TPR) repeat protein